MQRDLGVDLREEPGAGAAGGLGFGLLAFCGARLRPGVEVVMDAVGLPQRIAEADLVITGEGSLDEQSLHGKVPAGVLAACELAGVPAAIVCGRATIEVPGVPVISLTERVGERAALDRGAAVAGRRRGGPRRAGRGSRGGAAVSGALDRFTEAARALGLQPEVRRFPEGTKTAVDAANAIGCDVGQIVKSLVFMAGEEPVLALTSGSNRVDEGKLAAAAGAGSARRATPEEARTATGFAVGGTPPFGHVGSVTTFCDRDLLVVREGLGCSGNARFRVPHRSRGTGATRRRGRDRPRCALTRPPEVSLAAMAGFGRSAGRIWGSTPTSHLATRRNDDLAH